MHWGARQSLEYISLLSDLHAIIRNGVVGYAPGVQAPNLDSTSRALALRSGPAADDDARAWSAGLTCKGVGQALIGR